MSENAKKKLLILNGSHSEIPLIKAAKKLGYHVVTTGYGRQFIGHSFADEYHCVDFSNLKDILSLSKKIKIDAICSCANDFGAITASYVAEQLSLPGHDTYQSTLILHHKDIFKKFALKHGIPTPNARAFAEYNTAISALSDFSYPLMIKPVDLTGGKGVTKVLSENEYEKAVKIAFQASPQKRIVIEEFIDGSQHSFSTFIYKGKVVFYFSDNEYSYLNPYLVSTSAAPSTNVHAVSGILIKASEKIVKLLSLGDGVFHIQYLYKNGKAMIIEITRRCSGDLYPYPVNKSTGIDWAEWIVKAETGMDCSNFPEIKQTGFCGRHCIMSAQNGIVKDVIIDNYIKNNIYDSLIWWKENDFIENYLVHKLGVILLEYQSMDEMIAKTAQLNELIKVIVK